MAENPTLYLMSDSVIGAIIIVLRHQVMMIQMILKYIRIAENGTHVKDSPRCDQQRTLCKRQRNLQSTFLILIIKLTIIVMNSSNDANGLPLRGHSKGVTDILFSRCNPLLYSVSKDTTLRAWKAKDFSCAAVYK